MNILISNTIFFNDGTEETYPTTFLRQDIPKDQEFYVYGLQMFNFKTQGTVVYGKAKFSLFSITLGSKYVLTDVFVRNSSWAEGTSLFESLKEGGSMIILDGFNSKNSIYVGVLNFVQATNSEITLSRISFENDSMTINYNSQFSFINGKIAIDQFKFINSQIIQGQKDVYLINSDTMLGFRLNNFQLINTIITAPGLGTDCNFHLIRTKSAVSQI